MTTKSCFFQVGVALWSCGIAVPAGEEINDVLSSIVPDFE